MAACCCCVAELAAAWLFCRRLWPRAATAPTAAPVLGVVGDDLADHGALGRAARAGARRSVPVAVVGGWRGGGGGGFAGSKPDCWTAQVWQAASSALLLLGLLPLGGIHVLLGGSRKGERDAQAPVASECVGPLRHPQRRTFDSDAEGVYCAYGQLPASVARCNSCADAVRRRGAGASIALRGRFMRPCTGDSLRPTHGADARLHHKTITEYDVMKERGQFVSFRWPCARCSPQASRTEPAPRPAPAQTLLDGKLVVNLGGFIVGTDFKASLNGAVDEQSGGRLRQDLRRRQRPDADPRRPAVADHTRIITCASSTSTTPPSRKRVIDADLAWGDNVFTAGGEVKSEDQPQDRRAGLRVRLHPPADVRAQRQLRRPLHGRGDQAFGRCHRHRLERQQHDGVGLHQERATSRRRCR